MRTLLAATALVLAAMLGGLAALAVAGVPPSGLERLADRLGIEVPAVEALGLGAPPVVTGPPGAMPAPAAPPAAAETPPIAVPVRSAAAEASVPRSRSEIALSFAPIVREAAPAVVNIFAERRVRQSPFAGDPFMDMFRGRRNMPPRVASSLGSGVIVSADGLVITNVHVIDGAESIRVVTADGREFDAELTLADRRSDLAALRMDAPDAQPAMPLADSDDLAIGDLVLAIGNPFGLGQTTTSGIVSGLARTRLADDGFGHFVQTDAAINPGNSGGALVDMAGRLVGINTAIVSRSGGSNGVGFAVPSNMVRAVIDAVARGETRLTRPYVGARFGALDADIADALDLERTLGAIVADVAAGGPADRAGLRPGDVVLSVDGRPLENPDALGYRLATSGVGREMVLGVRRDGREREVRLTLEPAPETPPREERTLRGRTPFGGATVANLSPALAMEMERDAVEGVVVTGVEPRSLAARAGIQPGDRILNVNGVRVDSTRTMARIAGATAQGWRFALERDGRVIRRSFR